MDKCWPAMGINGFVEVYLQEHIAPKAQNEQQKKKKKKLNDV